LTIIEVSADMWIEYFHRPRATVAAAASRSETLTLTKPGRFAGGYCVPDANSGNVGGAILVGAAVAELDFGDAITQVQYFIRNISAGNLEIGAHIMVWLKK